LPQSASEVEFENQPEGKTGWSRYEESATLQSIDLRTAYDAAKAGMADAGFVLQKADYAKGVVLGEHGMTWNDWNVIAGVYLHEIQSATEVRVIVQGSKDIGLSGDTTGDTWTGKILKGIRSFVAANKPQR
jgi:hypothetical protein